MTVHSAVMSSELMGTAPTDLPYILRVESRQRCWPVQNLYLLAPSFPVKQKWVTSLEFVLDEIKKKNNNGEDQVCKVQWNKRVNLIKTRETSFREMPFSLPLGNEALVPPVVRSNYLPTLSFVVVALQKLMGNVLLHLEEGERLDINCTKLLNDEVRSTKKYTYNRDYMDVPAVRILNCCLTVVETSASFRFLLSNQKSTRALRTFYDILSSRIHHMTWCRLKTVLTKTVRHGQFLC